MARAQAEACRDRHGHDDPLKLVIACRCADCEGELHADSISAMGHGFLICSSCRCAYKISATKAIRR